MFNFECSMGLRIKNEYVKNIKAKAIFSTLLIILSFVFMPNYSKADDYKKIIYEAYISSDMQTWKKTIDEMQKKSPKSNEFLLELVNYQYGYIGWCMGNDKEKTAETYLELAEANIKILEDKKQELSLVNSYKSAFYGFRVGLNMLKAPFIGPKSTECAELAMELDRNNPFGYIQYANSQYYMPETFGGSKEAAIKYYRMAQKIMEANSKKIVNDWNYLSVLTTIAQAYEATKQYEKAEFYYKKILKFEPDFKWVKDELYPNFQKIKNK